MAEPSDVRAPGEIRNKIEREKIGGGSVSDAVARTDALGFEPYVKAVAKFLASPTTDPPITISIEGEWGAGKSSFMRLLRTELKDIYGERKQHLAIVEFNAWRNDKEEALWAAFAIEFLRQLAAPLKWRKRLWAHVKLWSLRFDLREGWYDLLRFAALLLAWIVTTFYIGLYIHNFGLGEIWSALLEKSGLPKFIFGLGGAAGYTILLFLFIQKFREIVGNPFAIDLKRYLARPDYEEHTAFIEKFHRDFALIVKTYLPNEMVIGKAPTKAEEKAKAFVFIDDLDRCEVPKAADLMQALNLLMSAESAPLIFILGIDREMISAGLAAKYERLLPYLSVSTGGTSDAAAGLEYGYGFLEKFIQLPFQVPRPRGVDIDHLLDSLGAEPRETTGGSSKEQTRPDLLEVVLDKDSARVRDIIRKVAPALDYNPRRLKQFVNAFRLKAFTASETGLFSAVGSKDFAPLTLEKLGKVVALSLRWPRLLTVLAGMPDLLSRMQHGAWALPPETSEKQLDEASLKQFDYWMAKPRLKELLRVPFESESELSEYGKENSLSSIDDAITNLWSLDRLDLERLLETSPQRKPGVGEPIPDIRTPGPPRPSEEKMAQDQREDVDVEDFVTSAEAGSSERVTRLSKKKKKK